MEIFRQKSERILEKVSLEVKELSNSLLEEKFVHKNHSVNVLISNLQEHDSLVFQNANEEVRFYTCQGKPNFKCNFIFDHPQDHYPLMLLLEMGRQMAISVSHLYKNIPFNTCKNTVDEMDFKIFDFVELDIPVVIGCIDRLIKNKPNIQIRELHYMFYQKGKKCCESKSSVSIMSTDLYNRYRLSSRRSTMGNGNIKSLLTNECLLSSKSNTQVI